MKEQKVEKDGPILQKLEYASFAGMFGMWAEEFKEFIEGKDMFEIYQKLKKDASKEIIVPESDNVFRIFSITNPDKIKVIWYLQDPYPRRYKNFKYQATGVAMDCSNSEDGKLQPSLELFYDAMEKDLGIKSDRYKSIDYLANQGIMFINTDLTCKLNKTESHKGLWEPFQKYFLEKVMRGKKDILYVLSGNTSQKLEKYINPLGNKILFTEHPAAAHRAHLDWNHKNVFSKINKLTNGEILWRKDEWDRANEPPF